MLYDENHNCAAFFDFDGIIFQTNTCWKVMNPLIGRTGARVSCLKAYQMFEEIRREKPESKLSDYFTLDEYEYETIRRGERDNVVPISRLLHYARHHIFRRDDLYVIVPPGFFQFILNLTDIAFEKVKNFTLFENPFHRAIPVYPPGDKITDIFDKESRLFVKTAFYTAFLKYQDSYQDEQTRKALGFKLHPELNYNKIFLYHTESELDDMVQKRVKMDLNHLVDGRNSIVPLYIADMPSEN